MTLLPSGKVLAAGGITPSTADAQPLASASLDDPASRSWSSTGSLHAPREGHTQTLLPAVKDLGSLRAGYRAQLLPTGEVLLSGTSYLDHTPSLLYVP